MALLIPNHELGKQIGREVQIEAATVGELIESAIAQYGEPVREAVGRVAIVVNGRNISYLQKNKTPLSDADVVWFVLPAGGG